MNIHICEESQNGSKIHQNWQSADSDARFTLQAALGLSWSQSLFVGQYNLVVEGITDFWYLSAFSTLLSEAGESEIDSELVITPAVGASKVACVATILKGQELDVCVLLDSDSAGDSAYEQLVRQWILDDKLALRLGDILCTPDGVLAIEDVLGEAYFLPFVNSAYKTELKGKPLTLKKTDKRSVVEKVEEALMEKGILTFNKGRVAKLILKDFAIKTLQDFDVDAQSRIRKVVAAINDASHRFRKNNRATQEFV